MIKLSAFVTTCLFVVLALGVVQADQEKVPLDKVPQPVLAAVTAKFPKAKIESATKEIEDGKTLFEINFALDKQHLHAMVSPEGKLLEIHREIEAKDVPDKVTKAIQAKYPKAKWEGIEHQANAEGVTIGYEIVVEASKGAFVEVVVDPSGKILKETKLEPKKDSK
jgi:hypothetical protein